MHRVRNSPSRFVAIIVVLLGMIGTCAAMGTTETKTWKSTQIVDFDGNGKTDVTLFDDADARWFTYDFYQGTLNQYDIGFPHGQQVVGDYDGDGLSDFALCYDNSRNGMKTWNISYSSYGPKGSIAWGSKGDIPVPADYDGDGKTDIAVFRPNGGIWYIRLSGSEKTRIEQFGFGSDRLVPADYDGDGLVDIAVMRPEKNEWYVHVSSDNLFHVIVWDVWLEPGDVLVPADYDGDGRADIAVYRSNGGNWIILETSSGNYRSAQFGNGIYTGDSTPTEAYETNLDLPMPGDFDGDGIFDIAVWSSKSRVVNVLPSSSSIMSSTPVGTELSKPVSLSIVTQDNSLKRPTVR